jgi:predicted nucleotidyltransferase
MKFFDRPYIFENLNPPTIVDEVKIMHDTTLKNMESELKIPKDVFQSFQIKDNLNPEIWHDGKLNPEVRIKLLDIATNFVNDLKLPQIKVKDVLFVGSLANYNWSKFSDIDLHIVVDFEDYKEDPDFIKSFFDAQKNLFNMNHDIEIHGHPVETYFQDRKEKLAASAVYSVKNDKWILKPQKESFRLDKNVIRRKVEKFFDKLKDLKAAYDNGQYKLVFDGVTSIMKSLKKMRQSGLEKGGEFSTENIIYKTLRRTDAMEFLDSLKMKSYDNLMAVTE